MLVSKVEAHYSEEARKAGVERSMISLTRVVRADGTPSDISDKRRSRSRRKGGGNRFTMAIQAGPDQIREYSAYLFRERKLNAGTRDRRSYPVFGPIASQTPYPGFRARPNKAPYARNFMLSAPFK